jgi:hypothetical protein
VHPIALALELDDVGVMEEAVEHGAGGGGVTSSCPQSSMGLLELTTVAPTS